MRLLPTVLTLIALTWACAQAPQTKEPAPPVNTLAELAAPYGTILEIPSFETSPSAVKRTVATVLATADLALERLGAQDHSVVSFATTIKRFDDISYPVATVMNRMWLMKETQPDAAMREACNDAVTTLNEWVVGVSYREDVYQACQAFLNRYTRGELPKLEGEDLKLMLDTMRDYRRSGMHLDAAGRGRVAGLRNRLNELESQFDTNITNAQVDIYFTEEELDGITEAFYTASRQSDGRHKVRVTVTSDYLSVMQNARKEETRKACNRARYSVALNENGPILAEMVSVREEIAGLLGYGSWADFQTEPKMAKTGAAALAFIEDLVARLEPKFQDEVEVLRRLKVIDTGDENAVINFWDFRYYQVQYMKQGFGVDTEALRVYFPLPQVIAGMFDAYAQIFDLEFEPVEAPQKWVADLELWLVKDASTGEPLGMFYLDNFPREGKYNHFAQFDIVGGKRLADGRYQRPVVALVCNFTPPIGSEPALMSHNEVETIFHEFGHAMHSILTRANSTRYAGANVARDFVEAPSQMFENWAWDAKVLGGFAADYRDPSKKIPAETLQAMKAADLATQGIYYRRQLSLALSDLRLHIGTGGDPAEVVNQATADAFFAPIEGTHFAAYWGHLTGYDAGYYGYAWADSIAADMATVFQNAPNGYSDREAGMRLRRQIYEVGGAVDPSVAVRRFLQREPSNAAFLATLGLGN